MSFIPPRYKFHLSTGQSLAVWPMGLLVSGPCPRVFKPPGGKPCRYLSTRGLLGLLHLGPSARTLCPPCAALCLPHTQLCTRLGRPGSAGMSSRVYRAGARAALTAALAGGVEPQGALVVALWRPCLSLAGGLVPSGSQAPSSLKLSLCVPCVPPCSVCVYVCMCMCTLVPRVPQSPHRPPQPSACSGGPVDRDCGVVAAVVCG